MAAYYNEHEAFAAEWLRRLIAAGHIAPGEVDERDIQHVQASDLRGFRQCHFFAGLGAWSHALRLAEWGDDQPVWTGSPPCQPFSAAGKRGGVGDARHLWPDFFRLIGECRPAVVFGEQVASPDGLGWLDTVSADLEGAGYAIGAADLCAAGVGVGIQETAGQQWLSWAVRGCPDPGLASELRDFAHWAGGALGVGAPHIRQRLFFVANALHPGRPKGRPGARGGSPARGGRALQLGHAYDSGLAQRGCKRGDNGAQRAAAERTGGDAGGMDHTHANGLRPRRDNLGTHDGINPGAAGAAGQLANAMRDGSEGRQSAGEAGSGRRFAHAGGAGIWSNAEWIACQDGKARAAEPGTFPLAHGASGRVGRLRAYGNAIVAPVAAEFIAAYREACNIS